MIFITGVNGSGKSSIIPHLRSLLNGDQFAVHDFDERGVPDNADRNWRLEETRHWIEIGQRNQANGMETIVCGFARPSELETMGANNTRVIMLDIEPAELKNRLLKRNADQKVAEDLKRATGDTVNTFIENNITFLPILREECKNYGCATIETSKLSPEEVAKQIISLLE